MTNGLTETENELPIASPTYSILTADRILERFNLHLDPDNLRAVMKNPQSIYFQILFIPFKNVFNGIVQQQAYDYQVYAQKLFVDYLVSGKGNEGGEPQGDATRQDLEEARKRLVEMGDFFDADTLTHQTLINESQRALLEATQSLNPLQDNQENAEWIKVTMLPFRQRAEELTQVLKNYRTDFKQVILDTMRLIQLLPDYHEDLAQTSRNREALLFDDQL